MSYVHNLDPFAIHFFDNIGIRWYSLAYLSTLLLSLMYFNWLSKKKYISLNQKEVTDFVFYGALGVILGGRLGYIIFYSPESIFEWSDSFPYWALLEIHKGGLSSHGGMVGVLIACFVFAKVHKKSFLALADLTVIPASLGFFFGRIANFINGELYGRPALNSSWAVRFPSEMKEWFFQRQTNELLQLKPAVEVLSSQNKEWNSWTWENWISNFSMYQDKIYQTIQKMILETQNNNPQLIEALVPILTPRYPSQIFQALLEGLFVFLILILIWQRKQKYGVLSAYFGILYGFMRIIGEQFRMPDSHIGLEALGLTRGQWLSVALVIAGFSLLAYSYKYSKGSHSSASS